jgi:hypothetical protein
LPQLLQDVSACIQWLEDDEDQPLLELSEKLGAFKKIGEPVQKRAAFFEQVPEINNAF